MKLFALVLALAPVSVFASWQESLKERISALDRAHPANLGVYIKSMKDGAEVNYHADRSWYLSSTTKVPVAVRLLQKVEAGELTLEQKLVLKESDYVDGAGDMLWQEPGTSFTLKTLMEKMLVHSDSTATDMLIRLVGEKDLNEFLEAHENMGPYTTILQVRYDAFGEMHPKAKELSNLDFIEFKKAPTYQARVERFVQRIGVSRSELKVATLEEAFEKFYEREINSSSLSSFGRFLEKLWKGELLNEQHTKLILAQMQKITTGERRIKAGLPKGTAFAQKTGTQVRRLCNIGLVKPASPDAVVITACVEKYPDYPKAEALLKNVGQALSRSGVLKD